MKNKYRVYLALILIILISLQYSIAAEEDEQKSPEEKALDDFEENPNSANWNKLSPDQRNLQNWNMLAEKTAENWAALVPTARTAATLDTVSGVKKEHFELLGKKDEKFKYLTMNEDKNYNRDFSVSYYTVHGKEVDFSKEEEKGLVRKVLLGKEAPAGPADAKLSNDFVRQVPDVVKSYVQKAHGFSLAVEDAAAPALIFTEQNGLLLIKNPSGIPPDTNSLALDKMAKDAEVIAEKAGGFRIKLKEKTDIIVKNTIQDFAQQIELQEDGALKLGGIKINPTQGKLGALELSRDVTSDFIKMSMEGNEILLRQTKTVEMSFEKDGVVLHGIWPGEQKIQFLGQPGKYEFFPPELAGQKLMDISNLDPKKIGMQGAIKTANAVVTYERRVDDRNVKIQTGSEGELFTLLSNTPISLRNLDAFVLTQEYGGKHGEMISGIRLDMLVLESESMSKESKLDALVRVVDRVKKDTGLADSEALVLVNWVSKGQLGKELLTNLDQWDRAKLDYEKYIPTAIVGESTARGAEMIRTTQNAIPRQKEILASIEKKLELDVKIVTTGRTVKTVGVFGEEMEIKEYEYTLPEAVLAPNVAMVSFRELSSVVARSQSSDPIITSIDVDGQSQKAVLAHADISLITGPPKQYRTAAYSAGELSAPKTVITSNPDSRIVLEENTQQVKGTTTLSYNGQNDKQQVLTKVEGERSSLGLSPYITTRQEYLIGGNVISLRMQNGQVRCTGTTCDGDKTETFLAQGNIFLKDGFTVNFEGDGEFIKTEKGIVTESVQASGTVDVTKLDLHNEIIEMSFKSPPSTKASTLPLKVVSERVPAELTAEDYDLSFDMTIEQGTTSITNIELKTESSQLAMGDEEKFIIPLFDLALTGNVHVRDDQTEFNLKQSLGFNIEGPEAKAFEERFSKKEIPGLGTFIIPVNVEGNYVFESQIKEGKIMTDATPAVFGSASLRKEDETIALDIPDFEYIEKTLLAGVAGTARTEESSVYVNGRISVNPDGSVTTAEKPIDIRLNNIPLEFENSQAAARINAELQSEFGKDDVFIDIKEGKYTVASQGEIIQEGKELSGQLRTNLLSPLESLVVENGEGRIKTTMRGAIVKTDLEDLTYKDRKLDASFTATVSKENVDLFGAEKGNVLFYSAGKFSKEGDSLLLDLRNGEGIVYNDKEVLLSGNLEEAGIVLQGLAKETYDIEKLSIGFPNMKKLAEQDPALLAYLQDRYFMYSDLEQDKIFLDKFVGPNRVNVMEFDSTKQIHAVLEREIPKSMLDAILPEPGAEPPKETLVITSLGFTGRLPEEGIEIGQSNLKDITIDLANGKATIRDAKTAIGTKAMSLFRLDSQGKPIIVDWEENKIVLPQGLYADYIWFNDDDAVKLAVQNQKLPESTQTLLNKWDARAVKIQASPGTTLALREFIENAPLTKLSPEEQERLMDEQTVLVADYNTLAREGGSTFFIDPKSQQKIKEDLSYLRTYIETALLNKNRLGLSSSQISNLQNRLNLLSQIQSNTVQQAYNFDTVASFLSQEGNRGVITVEYADEEQVKVAMAGKLGASVYADLGSIFDTEPNAYKVTYLSPEDFELVTQPGRFTSATQLARKPGFMQLSPKELELEKGTVERFGGLHELFGGDLREGIIKDPFNPLAAALELPPEELNKHYARWVERGTVYPDKNWEIIEKNMERYLAYIETSGDRETLKEEWVYALREDIKKKNQFLRLVEQDFRK